MRVEIERLRREEPKALRASDLKVGQIGISNREKPILRVSDDKLVWLTDTPAVSLYSPTDLMLHEILPPGTRVVLIQED